MSEDDRSRLPPISTELRDEFREDVLRRYGGIRGHYRHEVEIAIREYLEASQGQGDLHDRLRRIEGQLEDISERLADALEEPGKNKKDSNLSETTRNRLDEIDGEIRREAEGGHVHEAVVRKSIEDVAGHSDPTIRRYKEMLVDRGYVYPHPVEQSRFALTRKDFVAMTDQLRRAGRISDDRYWELVDHIGEDEFRATLEDIERGDKGFQ